MKNKAPLALMEQLIMLLVFSLAAALCLQVFVLSDHLSRSNEVRDRAVTAVQNAAETLKVCQGDVDACVRLSGGTVEEGQWQIAYDEDWQQVSVGLAAYQVVTIPIETTEACLSSAEVAAQTAEGERLFNVTVSWQENLYE